MLYPVVTGVTVTKSVLDIGSDVGTDVLLVTISTVGLAILRGVCVLYTVENTRLVRITVLMP